MDGVGEGFAGALPCSLAEAKAEAKAEVGPAPEEGKPVPHIDAKAEEKPAEAKAGDKRLKLSPEEKDRVKGWTIPGLQSWRMRLRSDPGLSPLPHQRCLTRPAGGPSGAGQAEYLEYSDCGRGRTAGKEVQRER